MDERIAKYEEKMTKTLANLESEFGTIAREERILTYWTVLR